MRLDAGPPGCDCGNSDAHFCAGHIRCPDCCHKAFTAAADRARSYAWAAGYFDAVNDLDNDRLGILPTGPLDEARAAAETSAAGIPTGREDRT